MLKSYFDDILTSLSSYDWVESADVVRHNSESSDQKDILLYRLRVCLTDGSLLEMTERIVEFKAGGSNTTKYSFHWQNPAGKLIRRWDNAPHFPNIPTHPFHIHIGEEDVGPSKPQNALHVLALIDEEFSE